MSLQLASTSNTFDPFEARTVARTVEIPAAALFAGWEVPVTLDPSGPACPTIWGFRLSIDICQRNHVSVNGFIQERG